MPSGGCLCGDIRVEVTADPVRAGICHCLDCRKNHGALFRPFAIFPGAAVTVTGTPRIYDSAPGVHRHFCGRCGSPLLARYDASDLVEIFVGVFDAPNATPPPSYEIWTVRREAWLPRFAVQSYEKDRW
jgi:hypothetical protein